MLQDIDNNTTDIDRSKVKKRNLISGDLRRSKRLKEKQQLDMAYSNQGLYKTRDLDNEANDTNHDEFSIDTNGAYIEEKSSKNKFFVADLFENDDITVRNFKRFMNEKESKSQQGKNVSKEASISFATKSLIYLLNKKKNQRNKSSGEGLTRLSSPLNFRFSEDGRKAAYMSKENNRRNPLMDIGRRVIFFDD